MKLYKYQKELLKTAVVTHMLELGKNIQIFKKAQMNYAYEEKQLEELQKIYKIIDDIK